MDDVTASAELPRRALLRSLAVAGAGLEVMLQGKPASAAEGQHAHQGAPALVDAVADANQAPVYFSAEPYAALCALCQLIIPVTGESGGAMEAGVPPFIDLLASENREYQRRLSGGLAWLDAWCVKRFGSRFTGCSEAQQKTVLDAIAFRANGERDETLVPGVDFFALCRDLVLDGYFTSKVGIEYLEFRGNGALATFAGCPGARA